MIGTRSSSGGLKDVCQIGSLTCSIVGRESYLGAKSTWAVNHDDDMCITDAKDDFTVGSSMKFRSITNDLNKV